MIPVSVQVSLSNPRGDVRREAEAGPDVTSLGTMLEISAITVLVTSGSCNETTDREEGCDRTATDAIFLGGISIVTIVEGWLLGELGWLLAEFGVEFPSGKHDWIERVPCHMMISNSPQLIHPC